MLLAEDNLVNQRVAVHALRKAGVAEVRVAENGEAAVQAVRESEVPFDVVLMDIQVRERIAGSAGGCPNMQ